MNEERRYGINWVDLIIKIILLILFVLLICWLFPMPKLDTFYDKVFNENIQTMKSAARDYYTKDRLPSAIGETKSMSLKQLIDNKLILEFSDKDGNACDTTNSYVQVTKTLDSEYALKVQLTCGDESDYIIDTIGCNGTCLLSDVNTTATEDEKDNDNDNEDSDVTPSTTSNYKGYTGGRISNYYYPLGGKTSTNGTTSTSTHTSTTTTIIKRPGSGSSNVNSNNSNNNNKQLYYQHAKIVTDYGNWTQGYKTGNNIETKRENVKYYTYTNSQATSSPVYRTTTWIDRNEAYSGHAYSYELQLTDIPSSVTNVSLVTHRYFGYSDYQAYLDFRDKNLYMSGNDMLSNSSNRNANSFKNSALKSNNFTYTISRPYKTNGVWRVTVNIRINNVNGVSTYYDSRLNRYIYYVPVFFKTQYSYGNGRSVTDTLANAYKYPGYSRTYAYSDTIYYYRYVNEYVDYNQTKWSTSRNLSGYKFTGNTKYI